MSWADGKPAGHHRGDQPNMKEAATDYALLIVSDKLPRARREHHVILPGGDPEREGRGKHWILLR